MTLKRIVASLELHRAPKLRGRVPLPEIDDATVETCWQTVRRHASFATEASRDAEQSVLEGVIRAAIAGGDQDPRILHAAALALTKLGHYPALASLERRFPGWQPDIGLAATMKSQARIRAHSPTGQVSQPFTPFQLDLLEGFQAPIASISAPTSAGKSFVLGHVVLQAVQQRKHVAYIVPTRALVREVTVRMRRLFLEHHLEAPIRSIAAAAPLATDHGSLHVLTQERFLALRASGNGLPPFNAILFDEAHEIAIGNRGILLEAAIEAAGNLRPMPRLLFASPHIENPEEPIEAALPKVKAAVIHRDDRSPVIHHHFQAKIVGDHAEIHLDSDDRGSLGTIPLSPPNLEEHPDDEFARVISDVAATIHEPETTTLLYCSKPSLADNTAYALADIIPVKEDVHEEIEQLREWIREEIHPEHPLMDWLSKGISVHYGDMPPSLRLQIEDLASRGRIEYVCCTSTLLSGVNLPCKNLVAWEPRRAGKVLDQGAFSNLAGRSGRIHHDIIGNVWVIYEAARPEQLIKPGPPPRITSAFKQSVMEGMPKLRVERSHEKRKLGGVDHQELANRAFDLTSRRVPLDFAVREMPSHRVAALHEAQENLFQLFQDNQDISHIIRRHPGLSPYRIVEFYAAIREMRDDLREGLIPTKNRIEHKLDPHLKKTIPWFGGFFGLGKKRITYLTPEERRYFTEHDRLPKNRGPPPREYNNRIAAWGGIPGVKKLAAIATQWVRGDPLNVIIRTGISLSLEKAKGDQSRDRLVCFTMRDQVKHIDTYIRFHLARQWHLTEDLLKHYYENEAVQVPAKFHEMKPLHSYLEHGTRNENILKILSLGFTRAAAQLIKENWPEEETSWPDDPDEIIHWIRDNEEIVANWEGLDYELAMEFCSLCGLDTEMARRFRSTDQE